MLPVWHGTGEPHGAIVCHCGDKVNIAFKGSGGTNKKLKPYHFINIPKLSNGIQIVKFIQCIKVKVSLAC